MTVPAHETLLAADTCEVNRVRALVAALACAATMLMIGAGGGDASSPPAVTGVASYLAGTVAQLNGTIHPDGLDSFWAFQYGSSATAYGHVTPAVGPETGTAPVTVATVIRGLKPGTTYHFRLVAVRGQAGVSGDAMGYTGDDASFTTTVSRANATGTAAKHARASLRSQTLTVRHGVALMPWSCTGSRGARCKAKVSLTARGAIGGRLETLSCGTGTFSAAAGKHRTVRAALGNRCFALVASASHHRLGASLKASFSQGTGNGKSRVTLVLG
jgi:hypothetical protein